MTALFKAFAPVKREGVRKKNADVPWNEHIESIVRAVATERGLLYGDFVAAIGRVPTKAVGRARDEAILRSRERYGYSSTELGVRFGMNHSSILSAMKRARKARSP